MAVLEFSDATGQNTGSTVAGVFRRELASSLGKEWVRLDPLEVPKGPRPVGLVGISQARQLGGLNDIDGLVTGRVLAYQVQRTRGRVWVSVSVRLLETPRGNIIWSQDATGIAPLTDVKAPNADFDTAIRHAAKEFIDDLLGSPS